MDFFRVCLSWKFILKSTQPLQCSIYKTFKLFSCVITVGGELRTHSGVVREKYPETRISLPNHNLLHALHITPGTLRCQFPLNYDLHILEVVGIQYDSMLP